jgi:ABC-type polar amino acid transport system ATPase subunit
MKKAVIVVGKANAGKSTTIKEFKILVKIDRFAHEFTLNKKRGYVLSTSFEESPKRDIEATVKKLSGYDFLVFASQGPKLTAIHKVLKKTKFVVHDLNVTSFREAPEKAREILAILKSN